MSQKPKITALENAAWMTDDIQRRIQPYLDQGFVYVLYAHYNADDYKPPEEDGVCVYIDANNEDDEPCLFLVSSRAAAGRILYDDSLGGDKEKAHWMRILRILYTVDDHEFVRGQSPEKIREVLQSICDDENSAKFVLAFILANHPNLTLSELTERLKKTVDTMPVVDAQLEHLDRA